MKKCLDLLKGHSLQRGLLFLRCHLKDSLAMTCTSHILKGAVRDFQEPLIPITPNCGKVGMFSLLPVESIQFVLLKI